MFVGEVEIRPLRDDSGLGLQRDLGPLGRRELHRLCEALLALVQVGAVHVGMVEEVDAGVACRRDQRADLVVALVRDPHQAEDDVGGGQPGGAKGNHLHVVGAFRGRSTRSGHDSADSRATSSAVSWRSAARTESRILSGREAPGIGMTTGARASAQASATWWGLTSWASATCWNAVCCDPMSPAWAMPPSGDQGKNAIPSSAQCSSSPRLERKCGENWFCTETKRPPRICLAWSICATSAFEMPTS